jgi:hypothetical protein
MARGSMAAPDHLEGAAIEPLAIETPTLNPLPDR